MGVRFWREADVAKDTTPGLALGPKGTTVKASRVGTMAVDAIEAVQAGFGWQGFPDAMFYEAAFGLRFELGGDLEMGPIRFLEALDRARAVAAELFSGSEMLCAFVSIYGGPRATRRQWSALQQLQHMGFRHPFGPASKVGLNDEDHIAQFGEDVFQYCYAAPFAKDDAALAALLWASIAMVTIGPKARWISEIHIADLQKRLVLTAYDDRGMDVAGPDRLALLPLYRKFNAWLLDYDRAAMDAKFAG